MKKFGDKMKNNRITFEDGIMRLKDPLECKTFEFQDLDEEQFSLMANGLGYLIIITCFILFNSTTIEQKAIKLFIFACSTINVLCELIKYNEIRYSVISNKNLSEISNELINFLRTLAIAFGVVTLGVLHICKD